MNRDSRAPASAAARKVNVRVGLFLFAGIVVAALAIFAIGSQSGMFERKTTLYAYFADVSGLVPGAVVCLAGLDVGTVTALEFPHTVERAEARVTLKIRSRFVERVRADSVVLIDSKGLLGDKILNITIGGAKSPPVHDGQTLKTRNAASLEHLTSQLQDAISSVTEVTHSANDAIKQLTTDQARADIARIMASTANILEQIDHGNGFAHRAIYDPKYGQEVEAILVETHSALGRVNGALEHADHALAQVEQGDGMLHELIYGQTGRDTMTGLRDAATGLASITGEVRDGKGLVHSLIYDPDNGRAMAQLNEAATRLNRLMANVEKGRGTLGGLMVDPTVYEDLKTILGNVQRNVLLKALIRFTIKKNDIVRPARFRATQPEQPDDPGPPVPPLPTEPPPPATEPMPPQLQSSGG